MVRTATVMLVVLAVVASTSGTLFAAEMNGIAIGVLIDDIRHDGKDAYSLAISTANASSRDIRVTIAEEGFFLQTDRGWIQLKVSQKDLLKEEFLLAAGKNNERTVSINIPLTVPELFRTYEGDLSLKYKYLYTVRTAEGTGAALERADEVYCWVKPGTSDWILREGM